MNILEIHEHLIHCTTAPYTRGIEKFSAKKTLWKSLMVSHFCLGFSSNKNNNGIKHSQRVSLDLLDPDLENSNETI